VDPSAEDALRLFSSLSALKQQRDELNKQIEALEDQFKKALSKSKALQEYITIP
jgi:chaperonin cofactor prefoldin